MHYHFIGICGAGMSAVAKLIQEKGHTVSGSDEGFYPPISTYLETHHIPCLTPYSVRNIPENTDIFVIGKHAKLTKEENEEVAYALSSHKKVLSFPQVLASITEDRDRIVVAGSFGKSTCTSLLSWCLTSSSVDTGYFIGAIPLTPPTSAHVGSASPFVFEGDEYPSSNWDSTSKFLYYKPHAVLLTALAHDHVNVFPTHEDYKKPFYTLLKEMHTEDIVMACLDDNTIASEEEKLREIHHNIVTYGAHSNAVWSLRDVTYGETTTFTLTKHGEDITKLETSLLGEHNVQNIIGVSALLLERNLISVEDLAKAIKSFKGIVRRLDKKSEKTSVPVYEGFGSSKDKALSAIKAIKLHFKDKKLFILFEPHTFSWRNEDALFWYDTVFLGADKALIYKPPTHGENTHKQLALSAIAERVRLSGVETLSAETKDEAITHFSQITKDSVVLILSSGNMDGLIDVVITYCEHTFPK